MRKKRKREGKFRKGRRVVYYDGSLRTVEPKIRHGKFICPGCMHSTQKSGLYCKAFKHYIEAKIVSCPFFRSRILEMFT